MRYPHCGAPADVVVGRTLTTSFIAALPDADKAVVANEVRALIARTPALAGKAEVAFPYITMAYDGRRLD